MKQNDLTIKKFLKRSGYSGNTKVLKNGELKMARTMLKEFCQYLEEHGGVNTKEFNDLVERVPGRFLQGTDNA